MRGETAHLYREMREEGYDPNRGPRPLLVAIVVLAVVVLILMAIGLSHLLHYWHQLHPIVQHT